MNRVYIAVFIVMVMLGAWFLTEAWMVKNKHAQSISAYRAIEVDSGFTPAQASFPGMASVHETAGEIAGLPEETREQQADIAYSAAVPAADTPSPAAGVVSFGLPAASAAADLQATTSTVSSDEKEISIPVLNYHSIGHEPGNSLVLDPDKFALQMEYLARQEYTPLSLFDFTLILEKKKPVPPKPVLLTFDDGYEDNYTLAMPVLKRHGFPATVFLSPGSVSLAGYLTWDQVKKMHDTGWDIEPHGMTHPHLPRLSVAEQKKEITEARRQIEERLGTTADVFCYPYGEFNEQTLAILQKAGFRYAFTINQGTATNRQHPLHLKRIYVNANHSLEVWSKKLTE